MLIFTVACLIKELLGIFDRYGGNHENFLLRRLSLYMSFDAEFNADSEYVHGFWVYFIFKGTFGSKTMFLGHFLGLF